MIYQCKSCRVYFSALVSWCRHCGSSDIDPVSKWCEVCKDVHSVNEPHIGSINLDPKGK